MRTDTFRVKDGRVRVSHFSNALALNIMDACIHISLGLSWSVMGILLHMYYKDMTTGISSPLRQMSGSLRPFRSLNIIRPSSFSFHIHPRLSRGYHTRHWIRSSRVQTRPGSMDFSERKNPKYNFLQKGSKAVAPMSQIYGT